MKKIISLLTVLILLLTATSAFAAGKVTVTNENMYAVESYGSYYAYVFARVENTGDKPVEVKDTLIEYFDKKGDPIDSTDWANISCKYLQPGEHGFLCYSNIIQNVESVSDIADFSLTVTGKSSTEYTTLVLPTESRYSPNEKRNEWFSNNYMYATVTNNTDQIVYSIKCVYVLTDANGEILYIDSSDLYDNTGVLPGSSIVMRMDVDSSFIDYMTANNLVPTSIETIAFVYVEK